MPMARILINGGSIYDFDVTKLSVYTRDIGLAGIEVYDLLRMNMISRLNWVTLPIFWRIFRLVTEYRTLSGWWGFGGHQAPLCEDPEQMPNASISSRQFAYHRKLLFLQKRNPCRFVKQKE